MTTRKSLYNCMSGKVIKIFNSVKKIIEKIDIKKRLKRLYDVASAISTISIFLGIVLFFIGKVTSNNQSDNDLIMSQVRKEVGDATITSINIADIHGFGNDSIVVTAGEETTMDGQGELIILDSVNNKVLNEMNDPLGLKSSYKTTFSQKLFLDGQGIFPYNVEFINVDKNPAKEFVVQYLCWGSNYNANFPAIYRYSYETEEYELFGTLPVPYFMDNKHYNVDGEVDGYQVIYENTSLDGFIPEQVESSFCHGVISDGVQKYDLPVYSNSCRYFWTKPEDDFSRNGLVDVYKNYDTDKYGINVYWPWVQDNKLTWGLMESLDDVELSEPITSSVIQAVLDDKSYEKWKIE